MTSIAALCLRLSHRRRSHKAIFCPLYCPISSYCPISFSLEDSISVTHKEYDIQCPALPLAVYREIAAHLHQVDQVETELLPQEAEQFDYSLSQIGWLRIRHPQDLSATDLARIDQILNFYAQRFGAWISRSDTQSAPTESTPSSAAT